MILIATELLVAAGLACLILGMGFVRAVRILRDAVHPDSTLITALTAPALA